MLDSDLAELYGVETKALKRAVRRNLDIFPEHFMFELTKEEHESLRYQTGTSNEGRGGTRYLPMVFTEHGIIHAAHVLRSPRARKMSVRITEIFIHYFLLRISATIAAVTAPISKAPITLCKR